MAEDKSSLTDKLIGTGVIMAVIAVIGLIVLGIWRMFWVTGVDNYEMAFCYHWLGGKIEVVDHTGWVVRNPFMVSVHTIDLRPYQITIVAKIQQNATGTGSSAIGARILNAKLVQFNPKGLDTFIKWHGRKAGDDLDTMLEILKAYAYNTEKGKNCPFLTVLSEIAPDQGQGPQTSSVPTQQGAK